MNEPNDTELLNALEAMVGCLVRNGRCQTQSLKLSCKVTIGGIRYRMGSFSAEGSLREAIKARMGKTHEPTA